MKSLIDYVRRYGEPENIECSVTWNISEYHLFWLLNRQTGELISLIGNLYPVGEINEYWESL